VRRTLRRSIILAALVNIPARCPVIAGPSCSMCGRLGRHPTDASPAGPRGMDDHEHTQRTVRDAPQRRETSSASRQPAPSIRASWDETILSHLGEERRHKVAFTRIPDVTSRLIHHRKLALRRAKTSLWLETRGWPRHYSTVCSGTMTRLPLRRFSIEELCVKHGNEQAHTGPRHRAGLGFV